MNNDRKDISELLKSRATNEQNQNLNAERFKESSKKRLMTNMDKKFRTTMIGALASFESKFGGLWGHGISIDELTEEQLKFRQFWDEVRTEILNKGNNQSRAAQEEIAQYTITWDKFKVEFIVKKGDN